MLKPLFRMFKACEGVAAVEFAFIAPVLIAMFFGSIELTAAVTCNSRVTAVASTAADLVAQETTVSSSDMSNVFAALNEVLYPYASGPAQIIITSIVDNGRGGGTVAWSNAQNATARIVGSTMSVPTGLVVSGSGGSVILAEISYAYASPTTQVLTGTRTMTSSVSAGAIIPH